jgi:hypothetical protein
MASSTRENLDKLQRAQRWALAWGVFGGAIAVALIAVIFYVIYVPGKSRAVFGTVVSFETHADGEKPRVYTVIHVRLENGITVRTSIHHNILAMPGTRVRLKATEMPIIGIERYSFVAFEKESGILDKVLR